MIIWLVVVRQRHSKTNNLHSNLEEDQISMVLKNREVIRLTVVDQVRKQRVEI